MAYRKKFKWIKLIYGLLEPLLGFPELPGPGEPFREITLNDYATENRNVRVLEAILERIYTDYRHKGYNMLQIASYSGDPLLQATRGFFSQPLYSRVILGYADPDYLTRERIDCSRPYIDIALT